jgi:Ca-activated chloride channel family protein
LLVLCLLQPAVALAGDSDTEAGNTEAEAVDTSDRTLAPYFFVEDLPNAIEAFPLEATHVRATIAGVIADVTVEQVYRNDGIVPISARYVFPGSTRAAVQGLQMQVGNQRVVAKIKEREQAQREFEEATAAGKTASLLEQERPNVFTMSIGNVMPGDQVKVTLRYSELLLPTDGLYQMVFPTVVGPRYSGSSVPASLAAPTDQFVAVPYLPEGDRPPMDFSLEVQLSTGVPIAELRCKSHDLVIARPEPSLARITLAAKQQLGFAGNRDFVLDYRLAGTQIQSGLLLYQGQHENHFLWMMQPPARVEKAQIPAREYVFVLDVSGSMYGFPLDTAKSLITELILGLRPTDTFNVELFSGDARMMAERSVPATQANVDRAIEMIEAERGGGGTELQAALEQVLELPRSAHVSRSVIVLTDGYISQERGAFELIAKNLDDTNLFAFGIGSSVNRYLIEGLARTGQGEPFVVTGPEQAAAEASRFKRYIESPVLTEIAVRFHGFDAYDVEPSTQPDLFANRPLVVMGKWRGAKAGEIEVTGRTPAGAFVNKVQVGATPARTENAALPQLWARSRIARLSDFDVTGEDEAAVREVTALGLGYSLLTQHTSFIAVLEQIRNPGGQSAAVDQPLPLPAGVSALAVGGGEYASGAEPELWLLLGLVVLGFTARARSRRLATLVGRA